jgi:quercetin dioxygenase-like cupin family protein
MRKTKQEKGLSRRMFCKLVSGGAVAIGSSSLMPSPSWKIGDAALLGVQVAEGAMAVVKMSEVPKEPYVIPLFTGPNVTRQSLVSDSKDLRLGIVNFGKGVRNKFHTHDADQVLIVTAGKGVVATEKEERVVTVGEVVLFPAGEKHWHGATKDSEFSHITVTKAGAKTTQLEN